MNFSYRNHAKWKDKEHGKYTLKVASTLTLFQERDVNKHFFTRYRNGQNMTPQLGFHNNPVVAIITSFSLSSSSSSGLSSRTIGGKIQSSKVTIIRNYLLGTHLYTLRELERPKSTHFFSLHKKTTVLIVLTIQEFLSSNHFLTFSIVCIILFISSLARLLVSSLKLLEVIFFILGIHYITRGSTSLFKLPILTEARRPSSPTLGWYGNNDW